MTIDLGPAAQQLATLVGNVPDDQLGAPTPCPAYTVGDLVDHIGGFAKAFTWAATKESLDMEPSAPSGDAARLEPGWRDRITTDIVGLAEAWEDPAAWTGMTKAGPIDLPGEIGGLVALDELVLHGWALAAATGQPFAVDPAALQAVHGFVTQFSAPGDEEQRDGLFGPVVEVADDAALLDRVLGLAGRRADWSPATA